MLSALLSAAGMGLDFLSKKKAAKDAEVMDNTQIRRRVADADAAGIHPLFALGANTQSYSANVGSTFAQDLGNMGADIDRSRAATAEAPARAAVNKLALERASLENDLLRAQIVSEVRRNNPPYVGPAMPGLIPEKVVDPSRTKGVNIGTGWETNPYFSDAQSWEDRWGDSEIGSMLAGVVNAGADAYWNMSRPARKYKKPFRPLNRGDLWKRR